MQQGNRKCWLCKGRGCAVFRVHGGRERGRGGPITECAHCRGSPEVQTGSSSVWSRSSESHTHSPLSPAQIPRREEQITWGWNLGLWRSGELQRATWASLKWREVKGGLLQHHGCHWQRSTSFNFPLSEMALVTCSLGVSFYLWGSVTQDYTTGKLLLTSPVPLHLPLPLRIPSWFFSVL